MINDHPDCAMVLAAGLGTRMRPLTDTVPKPLVRLDGRALLDHVLDRIAAAGISRAVVNVHYLAGQIEQHVQGRQVPAITISDERDALLDTGGGVVRALPLLGRRPFLVHNSDSVWIEPGPSNIRRLAEAWDGASMDGLLLLASRRTSLGYEGKGDFELDVDGRIRRRNRDRESDYVFTGVSMADPRLLDGAPQGAFSLNRPWDEAIARGRLYGILLDGIWMHVGTPEALEDAGRLIARERGNVAATLRG
jgi:MurNAc alpha-1-phosphate uridylyltransferase